MPMVALLLTTLTTLYGAQTFISVFTLLFISVFTLLFISVFTLLFISVFTPLFISVFTPLFISVFTPLFPNLTLNNPVHNLPYYLWVICLNITQPSTLQSHTWTLPIRSSDENFVSISQLLHTCATAPVVLTFHHLTILTIQNEAPHNTSSCPFCRYKYFPLYPKVKHPRYAHSSTPIQNYQ